MAKKTLKIARLTCPFIPDVPVSYSDTTWPLKNLWSFTCPFRKVKRKGVPFLDKKDDGSSIPNAFTVDPDTTDMPSITRLLDRKKLETSKSSPKAPPAPPPAPAPRATPPEPPPTMRPPTPSPATAAAPPSPEPESTNCLEIADAGNSGFQLEQSQNPPFIQGPVQASHSGSPAPKRAERRAKITELAQWQTHGMRTGADPLGKGLAILIDKGAKSALYLAMTAPPAGSPVPHFVATATVSPGPKLQIWTGCKWDPVLTPDTWNKFVQAGYVELSPPGTTTNMKSNRNIIRAAFGITQDEWLLLVRIGSAQTCRGVLAIVSTKSLLPELPAALPLLSIPYSPPAKSAA